MVEFLSPEWFEALRRGAAGASVPPDLALVVQEVIGEGPDEVAFAIRLGGGRVEIVEGRVDDADVSFRQDIDTARAIASGALAAQAAFMEGRLKVGGDLRALLANAAVLAGIDDVFRDARAAVAW
ncbi:MAG: SCP2 sterol-binding domain-containing protein [Actinomycetota bacterium]|nr:SCP2 sterol-binding domain-containing protein [Actinomycetota bacterium]